MNKNVAYVFIFLLTFVGWDNGNNDENMYRPCIEIEKTYTISGSVIFETYKSGFI